jgi:hypothetical protein
MTQTELKRQSGLLFEAVMRIAGDMTGMSIFVTARFTTGFPLPNGGAQ